MAEQLQELPGFIGPSNKQRSERFDTQRTVNMYVELSGSGTSKGGAPAVLLSTPGLRVAHQFTGGTVRGLYTDTLGVATYVAIGSQLWVTTDKFTTVSKVGDLKTNEGPVQFADNGSAVTTPSVMLVDGLYGYTLAIFDPVNTFAQITSDNFYPSHSISFQDGYFILNRTGTGYFFLSDLNDITFGGENLALKSGYGDIIVATISNNRELYLFGTRSIEFWWDVGNSPVTPFQRIDGKFTNVGCSSAATVKKLADTLLWLGPNEQGGGVVYAMTGDVPTRVSTNAVELSIQAGNIFEATAYAYQDEGHYFYVLNVPNTSTTWVYDVSTKLWAERQSFSAESVFGRHLGEVYTFNSGTQFVGSYFDGTVYVMDHDYYLDGALPIVRIRQSPHKSGTLNNQFVTLMQVDAQMGVGLDAGTTNAVNPMLVLEVSRDGGQTWSLPIKATLGKIGTYNTRARWNRLGKSRDFVFRVSCSDPVNLSLLSAYLVTEQGYA